MASREELLQSIRPDMKLDRAFFLKVYGYEITWPGFKDIAIKALNEVGCTRAEEHYNRIVSEYEQKQDESIKPVAERYLKQCQDEWERKIKEYERKIGDDTRKQEIMSDLHQMSDRELLNLLQNMN